MADTLHTAASGASGPAERVVTVPPSGADTIRRTRRQRRPTGAPPPLPHKLGRSGAFWLGMMAYVSIMSVLLLRVEPLLRLVDRIDTWWLNLLAGIRAGWLTEVMRAIKVAGSGWGITGVALALVVLLIVFRRSRHLLVFVGALFAMHLVEDVVYHLLTRPRPYGVTIISGWGGFAIPSSTVATLAALLVAITYTLVVPGRPRWYAKIGVAAVTLLFVLAREYLGVDGPSDALFGLVLGVAIPLTAFRLYTPNEAFPVVYRKGRSAHLDVTGNRGEAIRQAVREQLGLTVLEIKPVGLESSGGSTPLRLKVEGDPDTYLFAKLYAKSHVRADRWYKLGRKLMVGALEDEAPFQSVRRFVAYEDYMLRLMRDAGIPVPAPYGIVEITPEREYMIVMEFFAGAVEIGEAEVDEGAIDEGLALIRTLWDAGVAHRDIKPANLMVRDGHVLVIDVFFVQVKPSPWRQAVDLGNMMLVLATRSDPELVYQRALRFFTRDEIAEAFAAARGLASPTQLRNVLKSDPRDLLATFRSLAPKRKPIPIQRWPLRRVLMLIGLALALVIALPPVVTAFFPTQNPGIPNAPQCEPDHASTLSAQAVPSAALIPCLSSLPSGWVYEGGDIHAGLARFWLFSDQGGSHAITVTLTDGCDVSKAHEVPSNEAGARQFEQPIALTPGLLDLRSYVFPGGCATYRLAFAPGAPSDLVFDVDAAISFVPRGDLVAHIEKKEDLALCGRGAPCPR